MKEAKITQKEYYKLPKHARIPQPPKLKEYRPDPHPQQARLDSGLAIPSLVTPPTYIPTGK
jgi:hypothetical protein